MKRYVIKVNAAISFRSYDPGLFVVHMSLKSIKHRIATMMVSKKIIIAFLLIASLSATAQSWQDTSAMIDGMLNRFPDSGPLGQLAISRNGQLLYSSARGVANLEYNVPLSKESKIEAGSVSKQFTAACILLLEQQGKLSLTDNIRKYVPEIPDYGTPITIQHLMHHTSGIKDFLPITYLTGWPPRTKAYSNYDYLHIISNQKALNNKPGDEFIYSNSNYLLLAIILERVAKSSLPEFANQYIFVPAGMKNTGWRNDFKNIVPNRATAYFKNGNEYLTEMPNENSYGHAALLTTAEDLVRWNEYYLTGKLGGPSLLSKQLTPGKLNNGKSTGYAAGLGISPGSISHGGVTAGYRANLEYFPQLGLSIAWLSNSSQPEVSEIPTAVRNLFIKTPQTKADTTIALQTFSQYMGAYREDKTGAILILVMNNDGIYNQWAAPSLPMRPMNNSTLIMGSQLVKFISANPGKALLISPSGDSASYTGIDSTGLDSELAKEYTGGYASEETEARAMIVNRNGKLYIKLKPGTEFLLLPLYKDGFCFRFQNQSTGQTFNINFERDTKLKVIGFLVSRHPSVRKIKYTKQK